MRNNMPAVKSGAAPAGLRSGVSIKALERWNADIRAASEKSNDIGIFDVIGEDYWTGEGVTAKRISAALRSIGTGDVVVNINSPGGDLFEGLAIYSLLREHPGNVTVNILGLAASAASIIAMAGDTVRIARAGFLMIHNCWIIAAGNRHDFREYADYLEPFDASMADIYSARSGLDAKNVQEMLDAESWIGGSAAIDKGLADELLGSDEITETEGRTEAASVRRVEAAMRASGMPRSEAKKLISEFKASLRDAASNGERDATSKAAAIALQETAAIAASLVN